MGAQDAIVDVTVDRAARRAGFTALYDENVAEVYRYIHRRCRDHATAEDVTHDTFTTAVRSVDDPSDINIGWLLKVANNRLIDVLRRQSRYVGKLRLIGTDDLGDDHGDDVAERLRVQDALDRLSVEHRLVLTLHYLDGKTIPELADELGRSAKSVEGLVTRARSNLAKELEKSDA
ncbi:MAG: RNA polymerase sigma factor [Acidimicrobiales bacterium]